MRDLEGAILAGGASRRMGRDKAALPIGGATLLDRVYRALAPVVERVRIVGRAEAAFIDGREVEAIEDLRPGLGPLSGIHAALAASKAGAVLVVACDLPFVTSRFLQGLADALTPDVDAVVPRPPSGPIPVCALYRASCLRGLEEKLARGELVARGFVETQRARFLGEAELARLDPGGRCLTNVNTPEDYERAVGGAE